MKNTTSVLRLLMQEPERKFSIDEIVEQTGLTRKQLKYAIKELVVTWRLVNREIKGIGSRDTTYWINPEKEENVIKMLNRPIEQQ